MPPCAPCQWYPPPGVKLKGAVSHGLLPQLPLNCGLDSAECSFFSEHMRFSLLHWAPPPEATNQSIEGNEIQSHPLDSSGDSQLFSYSLIPALAEGQHLCSPHGVLFISRHPIWSIRWAETFSLRDREGAASAPSHTSGWSP